MTPTAKGSIAVAVTALAISSCGGKGERQGAVNLARDDAGLTVDPCNLSETVETQLIGCGSNPDVTLSTQGIRCPDFEHGPPTAGKTDHDPLELTTPPTDPGYWTADTCKSAPAGTVCVSPNSSMDPTLIPSGEGHCGTGTHAYHMVARGQLRWGPQAYIQYDSSPFPTAPAGINISDWDGMAFWIKKGPEPTGESVFISIVDAVTNGATDANGVNCITAAQAPDPVKCDQFGFSISFTDEWEYRVLPFSDLHQRGFGVHEPGVDLEHVIMLKFGFDIGDWNVWIDDISLYRRLN